MHPTVSVVMPTYNRAGKFLQEAITSLLRQTYSDFELIVVDDASQDTTEEIITSFNDNRIVYKKTDHNHGEYWSTNYGMGLTRGKYATWLHSDDILPIDSLELRVKKLEEDPTLDFVHGAIVKIDENGTVLERLDATTQTGRQVFDTYIQTLAKGKMVYLVHHTTVLMKREFFYKAGLFDDTLPFAGDIDWLIRALRIGNFTAINQILYNYRKHSQTRRVMDVAHGINKEKVHKLIASRYV